MPINYKEYPSNWLSEIRPAILKRAENKCETCGAENYKPHPITGSKVILTISHQDHNKQNSDPSNLKALCQRCHLAYDKDHHISNRKLKKFKISANFDISKGNISIHSGSELILKGSMAYKPKRLRKKRIEELLYDIECQFKRSPGDYKEIKDLVDDLIYKYLLELIEKSPP